MKNPTPIDSSAEKIAMESDQQSRFSYLENLKIGERYTLLTESEMGFGANATQFVHVQTQFRRYAQYDDAVRLVIRPKGKRLDREVYLYERKTFAIFPGWIDLDTEIFGPEQDNGIVVSRKMKYASCDPRFFTDAMSSTKTKPIFEHKGH